MQGNWKVYSSEKVGTSNDLGVIKSKQIYHLWDLNILTGDIFWNFSSSTFNYFPWATDLFSIKFRMETFSLIFFSHSLNKTCFDIMSIRWKFTVIWMSVHKISIWDIYTLDLRDLRFIVSVFYIFVIYFYVPSYVVILMLIWCYETLQHNE